MLQKLREKMKSTQRGAIMVFFAILVPLFLGMIGFAIDAGFLYMQKAKLQDIADAAALAGAGHLADGDKRESNATQAVKAFGGANGMQAKEGTSPNYIYLGDKVKENDAAVKDQLTDNSPWRIAQAIDTQMTDKDGKNRDHVRVIIWKRVPTFFIRFLFPDEKYVVVKAMAAAEYVEGEQVQEASDGPCLMAYSASLEFHSSNIYGKNGKGIDNDLYINSGLMVKDAPLPLYASYYALNEWSSIQLMGDKDKNKYKPFWWGEYGTDEQKKDVKDVKNKVENLHTSCERFMNSINVNDYKNGNGNKIYIDRFGVLPKNVNIDMSKAYDIYVDATNMTMDPAKDQYGDGRSIICNRYLYGIRKINNLIVDSQNGSAILNTEGITYNNVFLKVGAFVEGKNNYFKGVIYNSNQVSFMGEENHYSQVLANNIRIGYGYHFDTGREGAANSNWKCYFGASSNSTSGSDTSSKSRVRLVI